MKKILIESGDLEKFNQLFRKFPNSPYVKITRHNQEKHIITIERLPKNSIDVINEFFEYLDENISGIIETY